MGVIKINCPVCGNPVNVDVSKALDEDGEVFYCDNCYNMIVN